MLNSSLLEELAKAVDDAEDRQDRKAMDKAIIRLQSIERSTCSFVEQAAIEYYLANANSCLRKLDDDDVARASWTQPLLEMMRPTSP